MHNLILANNIYEENTVDLSDRPEDRNFTNTLDDSELGRVNPKKYDKKTDWYNYLTDGGYDEIYENRFESTEVTSSLCFVNKKWNFNRG